MPTDVTAEDTEVAILGRVLETQSDELSPAVAESWLKLRLPDADEARLRELSARAKREDLSLQDQALLENYLHVGRLIDLLKSKARLSLKSHF